MGLRSPLSQFVEDSSASRSRGSRAAFAFLVIANAGVLTSSALAAPTGAEGRGDAAWRRGRPAYMEALRAWDRHRSIAEQLGDGAALTRSGAERRLVQIRLRDWSGLAPAPRTKRSDPVASSPIAVAELETLARLLGEARKRHARIAVREPGDELLLAEAAALAQRWVGDVHLVAADKEYVEALRAVAGDGPESTAARVRLSLKLRRFAEANALAAANAATLDKLNGKDLVDHLRNLQTLARLDGRTREVAALSQRIVRAGGTAEERALPAPRFSPFLTAPRADLARVARTLLRIASDSSLPTRELRVASLIAGAAAMELGEFALADQILRGVSSTGTDSWLRASVAGRTGLCRLELGDYEGALHSLSAASDAVGSVRGVRELDLRLELARARAQLGLGQLEAARQAAFGVLSASRATPRLKVDARLLLAAVLYEDAREAPRLVPDVRSAHRAVERELAARDDWPKVERVEIETALAVGRANTHRLELIHLGARATPAQIAEHRRAAIALQDEAMRKANDAGLFRLAAVAAANLGELYVESGDQKAAERFVRWALERAREHRQFETEWRCHWYLGRIASARGEDARAEESFARALKLVESYRSRVLDFERRSGFLSDKASLYRDLVARRIAAGDAAGALGLAERAKARALVESIGWRYVRFSDPADRAVYTQFVDLLGQAERARRGGATALFGAPSKPASYDSIRSRLDALKEDLRRRARDNPALAALVDGQPLSSAEIRAFIPKNTVLVEYFAVTDGLVAFLVDRESVAAVPIDVRSDALRAEVSAFVRGGAADGERARRLYGWLVAPLASRLSAESVVIVPYGPLHQLPFETLIGPRGPLVREFELSYLPAASLLRFRASAAECDPESLRLFAVVDPVTDYDGDGERDLPSLPGARKEVEGFAWRFGDRTEILAGAAALEPACVEGAGDHNVIHYACHGEFYPTRPWDSPLFVAPGKKTEPRDDGRLRAGEVYGLDLSSSCLVTLSGCETGKNEVRPGDDPVSLSTAFLHSGASSLLVSLWKVEDEATAELMKRFYSKWIGEKKSKARALREAKTELSMGAYRHPRQWGAFILIGEP